VPIPLILQPILTGTWFLENRQSQNGTEHLLFLEVIIDLRVRPVSKTCISVHYILITPIKRNRPNELGAKTNPKTQSAPNCKYNFIRHNAQLKAEHTTESKITFMATEDTAHSTVFITARVPLHVGLRAIERTTSATAQRTMTPTALQYSRLKKLSVTCVPASVSYSHVDSSGVKGRPDVTNTRIHTKQNICLLCHGFYTHRKETASNLRPKRM